jgi:hypothetical protein
LFMTLDCQDRVMPYVEYAVRRLSAHQIVAISERRLAVAFSQVNTAIDDAASLASDQGIKMKEARMIHREKRRKLNITEHVLPASMSLIRDAELSLRMDALIEDQTVKSTLLNEREFCDTSQKSEVENSCYRVHPAQVNRAVQMRQDYVENMDGPLARTTLHLLKIIQEKHRPKPWYLTMHENEPSRLTEDAIVSNGPASFLSSDLLQKRPDKFKSHQLNAGSASATKWVHPVLEERLTNLETFLVTPTRTMAQRVTENHLTLSNGTVFFHPHCLMLHV